MVKKSGDLFEKAGKALKGFGHQLSDIKFIEELKSKNYSFYEELAEISERLEGENLRPGSHRAYLKDFVNQVKDAVEHQSVTSITNNYYKQPILKNCNVISELVLALAKPMPSLAPMIHGSCNFKSNVFITEHLQTAYNHQCDSGFAKYIYVINPSGGGNTIDFEGDVAVIEFSRDFSALLNHVYENLRDNTKCGFEDAPELLENSGKISTLHKNHDIFNQYFEDQTEIANPDGSVNFDDTDGS